MRDTIKSGLAVAALCIAIPAFADDPHIITLTVENDKIALTGPQSVVAKRDIKVKLPKGFNHFAYKATTSVTSVEIPGLKDIDSLLLSLGGITGIARAGGGVGEASILGGVSNSEEFLNSLNLWIAASDEVANLIRDFKDTSGISTMKLSDTQLSEIQGKIASITTKVTEMNRLEGETKTWVSKVGIGAADAGTPRIQERIAANTLFSQVKEVADGLKTNHTFLVKMLIKAQQESTIPVERVGVGRLATATIKVLPTGFINGVEETQASISYTVLSSDGLLVHTGFLFDTKSRVSLEKVEINGSTGFKSITESQNLAGLGIFVTKMYGDPNDKNLFARAGWTLGTTLDQKDRPIMLGFSFPFNLTESKNILLTLGYQWRSVEEGQGLLSGQTNVYETFRRKTKQSPFFSLSYSLR